MSRRTKLIDLVKEITTSQGYSKYIDGNTTSGNSKDQLDQILKNIADGGMDYEEDLNEATGPNIMFNVYSHIIDKLREREEGSGLRMSLFEEIYPTASSFYHDIEHLLNDES